MRMWCVPILAAVVAALAGYGARTFATQTALHAIVLKKPAVVSMAGVTRAEFPVGTHCYVFDEADDVCTIYLSIRDPIRGVTTGSGVCPVYDTSRE